MLNIFQIEQLSEKCELLFLVALSNPAVNMKFSKMISGWLFDAYPLRNKSSHRNRELFITIEIGVLSVPVNIASCKINRTEL